MKNAPDSDSLFDVFRRKMKFGAAVLCLGIAGTLSFPLGEIAWNEARERIGTFSPEALERSAGTGVALGTLGGFRTVLADIAWLRAFHFWGKRDPAACLKYCDLAMTLAPEQLFFLENTANYVAFEFPVWEIRKRGGFLQVPESVQREIHKKALANALEILDKASLAASENPQIYILAAQLTAIKTDRIYGAPDYAKSAAYYRRACECPNAPLFAFASYARFVGEHVPAERASAKAFLEACRDRAETPARKHFFSELLTEYFASPANG